MDELTPLLIASKAGVKRDGTQFEGDHYVDAKWCRFQRGLPRKMQGYRNLGSILEGPSRELHLFSSGGFAYLHSGWSDGLEMVAIDQDDIPGTVNDRTPAAFPADDANDWQFDVTFDATSVTNRIIAHAAPNLVDIDSAVANTYYYGDVTGTGALTAVTGTEASGGIVVLQPYTVRYSSDGFVGWSVPNKPDDIVGAGSGNARPTGQKIVKGLPLRSNSGNSPAGLLWSLDSILRMYFVGGTPIFAFDTISTESSILSANSVIEYDGVYYWIGADRFLSFNGVLQELPNDLNLNFFFDNLNLGVRGKTYAYKVPRYGEIWWCAPLFGATEPNWAIIYNVRESKRLGFPVWYDTPLPENGRSAGIYTQTHKQPFMMGIEPDPDTSKYPLWHHEEPGPDKIDGDQVLAVESFYETADFSLMTMEGSDKKNRHLKCEFIEPDFVQSGNMQVQVSGRDNARSAQVYSEVKTFPPIATTPSEQIVKFRESRRQMRFKFISNVVGGNYQSGTTYAQLAPTEGRITS